MMSLRYLIKVLLFVMGILLTVEAMHTRSCKGKSPMVPISEEDADLAALRHCAVMPANADDDVRCPPGSLRLMARTNQGVEEAVIWRPSRWRTTTRLRARTRRRRRGSTFWWSVSRFSDLR
jgi:hypothetical protein